MHTYLAFTWPAADPSANDQSTRWACALRADAQWRLAFRRPGLEVWTSTVRRTPVRELQAGGPVLIGDLFGDRADGRLAADPVRAADQLCRAAWGSYVALIPDPSGEDAGWAFRDPGGAMEVLTWRAGRLAVVSDDVLRLPPNFLPDRVGLDWNVITEIVRRPLAAAHLTPLSGLQVLAPGDLQRLGDDGGAPTPIWRPRQWAAAPRDASPDALRASVLSVVSQLADLEPRLLLEVSGGLDSAIVAAA